MEASKKYHFIGIGGIGMSALATWLLKEGCQVSGSDVSLSPITKQLEKEGATVIQGHFSASISHHDSVVFSSGISPENVELKRARELGCEILHRSDLIRRLVDKKPLLAIAGAHGKTTTTALLSEVLEEGGFSPSFFLGGISLRFNTNGRRGEGKYVVLEADESDGSFLNCTPQGAIITNIDREHLSYWKTEEALHQGFLTFQRQVTDPHLLFYWGDDPILSKQVEKGVSYGCGSQNDLIISDIQQKGWELSFTVTFEGKIYRDMILRHIGAHQALNAGAVFGLALRLGVPEEKIRQAFLHFKRVKRRLEIKGEKNGVLFLDDYGHHPTEIAATLKGVKSAFPDRRLVVVFQPHRYSRTEECLPLFAPSLQEAGLVILTEICAAGETPNPRLSSELIQKDIKPPSHLIPRSSLATCLFSHLQPGDICLSLGAGDITYLFNEL